MIKSNHWEVSVPKEKLRERNFFPGTKQKLLLERFFRLWIYNWSYIYFAFVKFSLILTKIWVLISPARWLFASMFFWSCQSWLFHPTKNYKSWAVTFSCFDFGTDFFCHKTLIIFFKLEVSTCLIFDPLPPKKKEEQKQLTDSIETRPVGSSTEIKLHVSENLLAPRFFLWWKNGPMEQFPT